MTIDSVVEHQQSRAEDRLSVDALHLQAWQAELARRSVLGLERLRRQSPLRFHCHRALSRVALWADEMAVRLDK
jgi:hypothetical protein